DGGSAGAGQRAASARRLRHHRAGRRRGRAARLANGSQNVTGIEINPIIADTIMRGRYADYAYHLYELPQVHIHVGDGRSYLRATRERYDVVQMTLVDTWASTAAGAFALSENSL